MHAFTAHFPITLVFVVNIFFSLEIILVAYGKSGTEPIEMAVRFSWSRNQIE